MRKINDVKFTQVVNLLGSSMSVYDHEEIVLQDDTYILRDVGPKGTVRIRWMSNGPTTYVAGTMTKSWRRHFSPSNKFFQLLPEWKEEENEHSLECYRISTPGGFVPFTGDANYVPCSACISGHTSWIMIRKGSPKIEASWTEDVAPKGKYNIVASV